MEKWVLLAIGLIISSVVLYLLIRKSKEIKMPIGIQNLGFFLPPTFFLALYNFIMNKSFTLSFYDLIIIAGASIFFAWLGNIASLKALKDAPNPGYSLIISKSYVLMTSIVSVWLFDSILTIKSIIAILFIVGFSAMIIIDKKEKKKNVKKDWIWLTLGAFLSWGFLALTLKYLTLRGLESTIILFYLVFFVSILILLELYFRPLKFKFDKKNVTLFLLIGVTATFFNLFQILGYQFSPNLGYINAANAGSIGLVTIFSSIFFNDELTLKKSIGVLGTIIFLIVLFF